ncbi:MAG: two-component sensor histidine kinase [Ferrovum sp.]|nr:two-component sensor histidine kinase [Ferrovum sp.]
MKRSLQRHLSLVLGAVILIAGLLAALASFALAYQEAKEFQDDMLRQIAVLSLGSGPLTSREITKDVVSDPESRVEIYRLPGDTSPAWLKRDLSLGLHSIDTEVGQMRVFVYGGRMRTMIVQPTEARNEIAVNSALRTMVPLLLLLPVLIWLIVRIVRHQLEPVAKLARSLDEQSAHHPRSLPSDDLPQEITPFVDAINRLLEKVNHLMGQQRRFIADAAHELRSPLAALSIQSQNLLNAQSLEEIRERVPSLLAGIDRATCLTSQLLNLARTQADMGKQAATNISAMARELIAEYLPLAEARHIDLGLDEKAQMTWIVEFDTLRLIIKNALENALKYTPEGGQVTLRLIMEGDNAIIEVVDNGPGIPVAERERVFDSFYRMPGTTGEGSGLGLAIAREAAIRMGGAISLHECLKGGGLVFRYELRGNQPST